MFQQAEFQDLTKENNFTATVIKVFIAIDLDHLELEEEHHLKIQRMKMIKRSKKMFN
jgi:hypothetical protein